jgi:hypothetical protein
VKKAEQFPTLGLFFPWGSFVTWQQKKQSSVTHTKDFCHIFDNGFQQLAKI